MDVVPSHGGLGGSVSATNNPGAAQDGGAGNVLESQLDPTALF